MKLKLKTKLQYTYAKFKNILKLKKMINYKYVYLVLN